MGKLIDKVKQIKELNELIGVVSIMTSNLKDNIVLIELKKEKTKLFQEAQEIAKGFKETEKEPEKEIDNKKSKKAV